MEDTNIIVGLVIAALFMVLIIGGGVWYLCCSKHEPNDGPDYTVAISNRLFKVSQKNSFIFH